MATHIVDLNSFRQAPATALPGAKQAKAISARRRGVATREKRNAATVVQIPTKANKKQRSEAAALKHKDECDRAMGHALNRLAKEPITGVLLVTATDLEGGDFNLRIGGVYSDDAEAALSTLECLVKYFQERAQEERNARAMAKAQPVKRPAFEVLL